MHNLISTNITSAEDDAIGDGLLTGIGVDAPIKTDSANQLERTDSLTFIPGQVERRRRKLPEIPKTKRCKWPGHHTIHEFSLFHLSFSFRSFHIIDVWPNIVGRRTEQYEPCECLRNNTAHAIDQEMWLFAG